MRILPTILSIAALSVPAAAKAQATDAGDVRCLLAMAALASNEQARAAAMQGVYYFAARVTARNPGFNFGTDLRAEAEKVSRAQFQAEMTRCGAIVQSVARNLQSAQASLQGFTPKE